MSPRLLAPLALALLALPASAGFKDGVFTSEDHGLRFRLPKGSKVDAKSAGDGKVALFETADGKLKGVIRHGTEGLGASKHAKWRASEWEKRGAVVTWDSEEKVEGKDGEWLKVVLELEAGEEEMKSAHLFVSRGKDDFELGVMAKAGDWDGAGKDIEAILASLEFGAFKDEGDDPPPPDAEPAAKTGGRTWADAARGIAMRGAEGWTWRAENFRAGDPYEILEWDTGDDEFMVTLSEVENANGVEPGTWADMTLKALGKSFKNLNMLEGKAPEGTERRDFTAENAGKSLRFALLFFARNSKIYYVQVITAESKWDALKETAEGVISGLALGDVSKQVEEMASQPAAADPKEKRAPPDEGGKTVLAPSPWEGCGKGSWVKYRMATEAGGTKTEMETTTTLVDFDDESYTVKTDMVMGGNAIPGQETKVNRRVPAPAGNAEKPEEGEETIKVAGGEFACHWVKSKAGDGWAKAWTSAEVPGRVVKTVSEVSGAKSEMELLDFEKK